MSAYPFRNPLFLLGVCICLSFQVSAQTRSGSSSKTPDKFTDNIWVGGAINNNLRFGGGTFGFGLAPMLGYELVPHFSAGPFVRMEYFYQRIGFSAPFNKFESFDIGPGIFARVDILQQYFAQIEYERAFLQRPIYDNAGNVIIGPSNKVLKETIPQNYVYLGAGYSAGARVRYGVSIHYNILDAVDTVRFPWDFRMGIRVDL